MKDEDTPFQQRLATLRGTTYSFAVANEMADKVAVFIHGVSGAKEDMRIMGQLLAEQDYATYLIDLPNHGKSSLVPLESFDQLGAWLNDALEAIGIVPDVLIGNSFGSALCYSFVRQGFLPPHTQLILACPTPDVARPTLVLGHILVRLPDRAVRPFYNSRMMITVRVRFLSRIKGDPRRHLRLSEIRKIPDLDVKVATRMGHMINSHNPFHGEQLPESIQRRTTILIGDRDNVVTSRSVTKLRELFPFADFDIIRGAGHILHFEAPERVVSHVRRIHDE